MYELDMVEWLLIASSVLTVYHKRGRLADQENCQVGILDGAVFV